MASRKEQKEQARVARIAAQQAAADKAQRMRRMQIFGGAIAIAVVVIVVAIVVSTGGGKKIGHTGLATGKTLQQIKASVNSVIGGIPESGTTLGDPKAPVTMQYFGDLECPVCQAFTLLAFPTFVAQEVKTGHVKVVYRSICTATCDKRRALDLQEEQFTSQQLAAYAAGQQDKFWWYAELFYHQQENEGTGYADNAFLTGLARQVSGLNVKQWRSDRSLPKLKAQLDADAKYADAANLSGTPTLVMSGKKGIEEVNGTYVYDGQPFAFPTPAELAKAVKQVS